MNGMTGITATAGNPFLIGFIALFSLLGCSHQTQVEASGSSISPDPAQLLTDQTSGCFLDGISVALHCVADTLISLATEHDEIRIRMVVRDFVLGEHAIEAGEYGFVELIDGVRPWGTDGAMPINGIESLSLRIGDRNIQVPKSLVADLFNLSTECWDESFMLQHAEHCQLEFSFDGGDGAGTYAATFLIDSLSISRKSVELLE